MKKIIEITSSHPQDDIRIFHKYSKYFSKFTKTYLFVNDKKDNKTYSIDNLDVKILKFSFLNLFIPLIKEILLFRKKDVILHFHDPDLLPLSILFSLIGYDTVFDYHEDYIAQLHSKPYLNQFTIFLLKLFLYLLIYLNDKLASMTIFVTPDHLKKSLSKNKILVENYPIISNLSQHDKKKNQFIYAGNISEHRGIFEMLDFIKMFDGEYNLKIAGKFRTKELYEKCKLHPGWRYVDYVGVVNRIELANFYHESIAGLIFFHKIPNNENSRPNKFYEYMEASLPIICTDIKYWQDFVISNKCGIAVNINNMNKLRLDQNTLIAMGVNSRNFIENDYNWQFKFNEIKNKFGEI